MPILYVPSCCFAILERNFSQQLHKPFWSLSETVNKSGKLWSVKTHEKEMKLHNNTYPFLENLSLKASNVAFCQASRRLSAILMLEESAGYGTR